MEALDVFLLKKKKRMTEWRWRNQTTIQAIKFNIYQWKKKPQKCNFAFSSRTTTMFRLNKVIFSIILLSVHFCFIVKAFEFYMRNQMRMNCYHHFYQRHRCRHFRIANDQVSMKHNTQLFSYFVLNRSYWSWLTVNIEQCCCCCCFFHASNGTIQNFIHLSTCIVNCQPNPKNEHCLNKII